MLHETQAALAVEAAGGGDQADVALGDQVHDAQAAAQVTLGDADHEAQVGLHELVERILVALLDQFAGVVVSLPGVVRQQHPAVLAVNDGPLGDVEQFWPGPESHLVL